LCDGEGLVEVDECLQLPLLPLDGDVELLDTYVDDGDDDDGVVVDDDDGVVDDGKMRVIFVLITIAVRAL
jgi:hypothetical protein